MTSSQLPPRLLEAAVSWADLDPSRFSYPVCLICGSSQLIAIGSLVINRVEFFIVRCSTCQVAFRTPIPDPHFLSALYAAPYYDVAAHAPDLVYQVGIPDTAATDQQRRRAITQKEIKSWLDLGVVTPADGRRPRLLEIGGGRGYLQRAAAEAGWEALGVEISPHAIRASIGLGIHVLPVTVDALVDSYSPNDGYFDIVAMFDFLEHVPDPGGTLRAVRILLRNGGIAIVRLPITEDVPRVHLIDHIWHFSEDNVSMLLAKERFTISRCVDSGMFETPHGNLRNVTVFAVAHKDR